MRRKLSSVKAKLFFILASIVIIIITSLMILNNIVLEPFYLYSKQNRLITVYDKINDYYNDNIDRQSLELELEKIALNNNFEITINDNFNMNLTTRNFIINPQGMNRKTIYEKDNITIIKIKDAATGIDLMFLTGKLDNGYSLHIRMSIASIQESVKIANHFLYIVGGIILVVGGVLVLIIARKFAKPILELNDIAKKMSKLDFSQKYLDRDSYDEIDDLGKSINTMSEKLEKVINELKLNNMELEKDIEEKSKINEMRKQFISDVSHELKTPIALIQGYAEGLFENIVKDEESKKFYAGVILDETNKMDKLVKQLLELSKLEYGKREFNDHEFNISELVKEAVRKSKVMLEEQNIVIENLLVEEINVYADSFYIDQVFMNYLTNAIKHAKEVDGKKIIKIEGKKEDKKLRISVFNTGDNIKEEDIARLWNRFYKVDESRNRDNGGTGIGLALVKAVMNNYQDKFGIENKDNGVEFYFELDLI